jgi:pimeloyl-ACP methyl ester carboxylesterase
MARGREASFGDMMPVLSAPAPPRRAFYWTSQGAPLFVWLHGAPGATHGVLICPPLGYEQVHSHRALRHLANALARAGMLVCRLDYHGTGDSAGDDDDADRVATWQANIRDALSWLEKDLGCQRLSIVGVRLGAALAWQAIAEHPIANLVLWAPVLKGRGYVREMQALGMAGGGDASEESADIEAAGFILSAQTAADISKFDAFASQPRCQRLLIVARNDLSDDRRLIDRFAPCGIDVRQVREPGYADMMAEPHYSKVPEQAIAGIVEWLAATPAVPLADIGCDHGKIEQTTARFVAGAPLRERILSVGTSPDLFGILTEPDDKPADDLPLVVLLNAGSSPRVGPSRLHVLLARQLAARGFRVLRVDLNGLGDSEAADPARENDCYPPTMFRDVDTVLRFAQSDLAARRVVLMGLCSGAYAGFQAAAQFKNPVLVESVLINPLTYYWKEGMSLDMPAPKEIAALHYYMRSALMPAKWWKLISGNTKIGLVGALRMLAGRWRRRRPEESASVPHLDIGDANLCHPAREDLTKDLKKVAAFGRHLACFFSASDPGYSILMYHARRAAKALRRAGKLRIFIIEGADHTFSRRRPRETALRMIVEYLCERYRPS